MGIWQRGAWPILENTGVDGTFMVANSKSSGETKHERPYRVLLDDAATRGQDRLPPARGRITQEEG